MYPRPVEVRPLGEYRLLVVFEDGVRAELDFTAMVEWGGVYEKLRDHECFAQARIDNEAESLAWPGEVDICPDVLYHLATGAPLPGELPRQAAAVVRVDRDVARVS